MKFLVVLNTSSEQIQKTSTKSFLGIFILPQKTREIDEMRVRTTFLVFYIIYQTQSITLHTYDDKDGQFRYYPIVNRCLIVALEYNLPSNNLQTVAKHYKRDRSAVCMTTVGNGLCKEASGT